MFRDPIIDLKPLQSIYFSEWTVERPAPGLRGHCGSSELLPVGLSDS